MPRAQARKEREQASVALTLAWVGGFVDATGYLVLFLMFTAHMSGNSIAMGVHVGQEEWGRAFHRFFPIPLYVLGVFLGAAAGEVLTRGGVRNAFALVIGLEVLLLLLFMAFGHLVLTRILSRTEGGWPFYALATLPALAMGVQNATLRRVGSMPVRLTYITGVLTNMAEEAVRYLFWLHDKRRQQIPLGVLLRLSPRQVSLTRVLLLLAIWVCYVVGAIVGCWTVLAWDTQALALPIAALIVVGLIAARYPLTLATQVREQKDRAQDQPRVQPAAPPSRPG